MLKEKYINILLAVLLVIAAVVRFPCDDLRLSMRLLFEVFVTVAFSVYVWKVNKWMALFLIMSMLSMLYPFYTRDSYLTFLAIFFAVAMYVAIVKLFNKTAVEYLYNAMCIIALINVAYLCIQKLGLDPLFLNTDGSKVSFPVALMGNQNFLSALLAFCFPAFMRRIWIWCIPLIVIGLILAKTTAGIIAIGAGLSVYFVSIGWPFLTMIPILFFILYIIFIDKINMNNDRLTTWNFAINLYKQHWIMGSGIGHWKSIGMLKRPEMGNIGWLCLHNEFLQGLFEMGIGFAVIVVGFFVDVLRRASQKALLPLVALTIISVNSVFNFPFHIGTTAMLGIVWLAILEIHLKEEVYE